MSKLDDMVAGLDFGTLDSMHATETIKPYEYTRPIDTYPGIDAIVGHIREHGLPSKHVYTKKLQSDNGRVVQDSFEKYLSSSQYYSSGDFVKAVKGTPLDLYYNHHEEWKEELQKFKNQKAFDLGRHIHACILEPTRWTRVAVEPKASRGSHEGCDELIEYWQEVVEQQGKPRYTTPALGSLSSKKKYIEQLIQLADVEVVSEEHFIIISILHSRWKMYENGIWKQLLKHAKREVSIYTNDYLGLPQRIRPDALLFKENIGVDAILSIKSSRAESIDHFAYQSAKLGYDIKEACYQEVASHVTGRDFATTIQVMYQTVAPFGIAVFIIAAEDIEAAKHKYRSGVEIAKQCKENGHYPGFESYAEQDSLGIIELNYPGWNNKELRAMSIN